MLISWHFLFLFFFSHKYELWFFSSHSYYFSFYVCDSFNWLEVRSPCVKTILTEWHQSSGAYISNNMQLTLYSKFLLTYEIESWLTHIKGKLPLVSVGVNFYLWFSPNGNLWWAHGHRTLSQHFKSPNSWTSRQHCWCLTLYPVG